MDAWTPRAIGDFAVKPLMSATFEEPCDILRTIIETSADCIKLTDRAGHVLLINAAGLKFLEVAAAEEVLGQALTDFIDPADRPAVDALHAQVLAGPSGRVRFGMTGRGGMHRLLESTESPMRNAHGAIIGKVCVTRDVTQQTELEQSLLISQRRLSEAQRIAQIGDWVWELDNDTITWSDEVYRIFGQRPQSFTPRYHSEFLEAIPPDDRQRVEEAVNESLRTLRPYNVKHRIRLADQSERIVRERGEVIVDESGRPLRMVGTVQDITEQVRVEDQLRSLQDELTHLARLVTLGEMASGIAHELNQPLTAIAAYAVAAGAALAAVSDADRTSCQSLLEKIEVQAQRAGEIIRRIRQMSRGAPSRQQRVDANLLARDVLALLAPDFRLGRIQVVTALAVDLPAVSADPIQIQQVLVNLLRNAVDALNVSSSAERQIELATGSRREAGAVWIRVRDTGAGLSPAAQASLFEAFRTTKPTGLGLGLAISRRIVEAHNGQIWHETPPEGGAAFTFTLPLDHSHV